jgi:hypothetical protein
MQEVISYLVAEVVMVAVVAAAGAVAMVDHKSHIPLRPVVSYIGSPCYALAGFLHKILSPLARQSKSFINDLGHFIQPLKYVNFQSLDTLVSFNSKHLLHVRRGLIHGLHKIVSTMCQERQDLCNAISSLRYDLQLNGYPRGFIDSVLNLMGTSNSSKEVKPLDTVYILHVKGISEKFKCIGSYYNTRIIFRTTPLRVHS